MAFSDWSARLFSVGATSPELIAIGASYQQSASGVQDALDTLVDSLSNAELGVMLGVWRANPGPFQNGYPGGGLLFGTGVAVLTGDTADDAYPIAAGTGQRMTSIPIPDLPPSVVSASPSGGADAWAPSTAYALNTLVTNSGSTYLCKVAHTSGSTFSGEAADWQAIGGGGGGSVTGAQHSFGNMTATAGYDFASALNVLVTADGTLNANCAFTISNMAKGDLMLLEVTQGGGGPYTLSMNGTSVSVPSSGVFQLLVTWDATDLEPVVAVLGAEPASNYQTVEVGGSAETQRAKLNLIAGSNITLTPADNSGANSTDVTIAASGGGGSLTYDQTILADNPQIFLPFSDPSGTTATDLAGTPDNGTYTGGFTLGSTGIGDGETGVSLNGTSGFITVPNAPKVYVSAVRPFSLEMWVKPTSVAAFMALYCKGAPGSNIPTLEWRLSNAGKLSLVATGGVLATDTTVLSTSAYNHVVVTSDNTSAAGNVIIFYVNGVISSAVTGTGGALGANDVTNPVLIGERGDSSLFFSGLIAKVAEYNYVLSPTQVARHFAAA